MYYDSYNGLEIAAKKAYHEDPWTSSSEEEVDNGPPGGEIEMHKLGSQLNDSMIYEGGSRGSSNRRDKKSSKNKNNNGGQEQSLLMKILSCGGKSKSDANSDNTQAKWDTMTTEEKEERIKVLWSKARRYNNKLRFQARLQKMAESNLKEMMIDDINEDADEENQIIDSQPKLKWYLIDTERTFCKVWNFIITLLIIYTLFVTPFILTFQQIYMTCNEKNECEAIEPHQITLVKIELAIDIIFTVEILLNFVKKTRAHKELTQIGQNYLTGYFIFDVASTLPELFLNETIRFYWLKLLRLIHVPRLTQPLNITLHCVLQKYSKKRQNDLTSFAGLILYVIYTSHIMACAWLMVGTYKDCRIDPEKEIQDDNIDTSNCT
jgi:sorbitol-specific phosphotransferase system component IIC